MSLLTSTATEGAGHFGRAIERSSRGDETLTYRTPEVFDQDESPYVDCYGGSRAFRQGVERSNRGDETLTYRTPQVFGQDESPDADCYGREPGISAGRRA